MKAILQIGNDKEKRNNVTITGPEIICIPVIKYLVLRVVNEKRTMVMNFYEEEETE